MESPIPCCSSTSIIDELNSSGFYYQQTHGRKLNVLLHTHDFFELVCVLSGACLHQINDEVHRFSIGSAVLLCPGDVHQLFAQEENTNILAISISPAAMQDYLNAYALENSSAIIKLTRDELLRIQNTCDSMPSIMNDTILRSLRLLAGELLLAFARTRIEAEDTIPTKLRALFAAVQNPAVLREGVPAFLRLASFSYSQLSRLTRRYLGMTPGEYITVLRLRRAYDLIIWSDDTCESISEAVGFSSFSHFSKLIRSRYGMSPARLRRSAADIRRTI